MKMRQHTFKLNFNFASLEKEALNSDSGCD